MLGFYILLNVRVIMLCVLCGMLHYDGWVTNTILQKQPLNALLHWQSEQLIILRTALRPLPAPVSDHLLQAIKNWRQTPVLTLASLSSLAIASCSLTTHTYSLPAQEKETKSTLTDTHTHISLTCTLLGLDQTCRPIDADNEAAGDLWV